MLSAGIVLASAVLLGGLSPVVSASPYGPGDPVSWTNGLVLCRFAEDWPSVAVSALSLNGTGVTVAVLNVSEVRANQSVAAYVSMGGLAWRVSNLSTEDAYDLAYSLEAPVVSSSGSPRTVGSAELSVRFVLPAYSGSPSGSTDIVNVVFSVVNWTWIASGDHLVVAFSATPSFPGKEQLNTTSAPGWLISSRSTTTGSELERVGANATASATTGAGALTTIVANSTVQIVSPESARLAVAFGTSAGEFTSIAFTAKVGIVVPSAVAGIPLTELAASGAAAVLVSVLVAAAARRLRKKPSKLVYVTEEEER